MFYLQQSEKLWAWVSHFYSWEALGACFVEGNWYFWCLYAGMFSFQCSIQRVCIYLFKEENIKQCYSLFHWYPPIPLHQRSLWFFEYLFLLNNQLYSSCHKLLVMSHLLLLFLNQTCTDSELFGCANVLQSVSLVSSRSLWFFEYLPSSSTMNCIPPYYPSNANKIRVIFSCSQLQVNIHFWSVHIFVSSYGGFVWKVNELW